MSLIRYAFYDEEGKFIGVLRRECTPEFLSKHPEEFNKLQEKYDSLIYNE